MKFKLPETLPADAAGLAKLRADAYEEITEIKASVEAGKDLDGDELARLRELVAAVEALDTAKAEAVEADEARRAEVSALLTKAAAPEDEEVEEDTEAEDAEAEDVADVVAEAESAVRDAVETVTASTTGKRPVKVKKTTFSSIAPSTTPDVPATRGVQNPGWVMARGVPEYQEGAVGFEQIARAIDSVKQGSRTAARPNRQPRGSFAAQTFATLSRELPLVDDSHDLVKEIERATDQTLLPGGSLVAAGGWCAPSETLYTFCDVPDATDLISLPEITIRRGGVRWPVEPDMTAIFAAFQFYFTETQLEAVDGEGNPTAIKECVEIPCPDEFEELRLNAVGYCVEAGILQHQGWPELTEWFMRTLAAEHLRAISRRTILDMVTGSGAVKIIPASSQLAAGSAFLNALALMAVNLRLQKGLARNATVEFVAPNWMPEAIRADLANQEGTDVKNVTDAQISGWLSARNLSPQWVADWQTRDAGLPGNLLTLEYPDTVDVIMYPAGTWFRAMSNVIELGVLYPRELLQINRYTRFFTEDAIAVGKRCNQSILVRVPVCASGAIGARQTINCNTAATAVNEVQSIAATGTVSGGTFTATFDGQTTAAIAWNASAATIKTALDALSNLAPADTVLAGGALPGSPVTITFVGAYGATDVPLIVIDDALITGGGSLDATVTTQGHS